MAAVMVAAAALSRRRSTSRRLSIARPTTPSLGSNIFRRSSSLMRSKRRDYALFDVIGDDEDWQGSCANLTGYVGPAASDDNLSKLLEPGLFVGPEATDTQVTKQRSNRHQPWVKIIEEQATQRASYNKDPDLLVLDPAKLFVFPQKSGSFQQELAKNSAACATTASLLPFLEPSLTDCKQNKPGETMAADEHEIKPDNRKKRAVFTVESTSGGRAWRISADVETLMNGSPAFQAMFSDRWTSNIQSNDNQLHVAIEDVSPQYFENVITFLEKSPVKITSVETALGTLCTASRYFVTPLCKVCIKHLLNDVVRDDALRVLNTVVSHCFPMTSAGSEQHRIMLPSAPPLDDADENPKNTDDVKLNNFDAPGCGENFSGNGEDDQEFQELFIKLKQHCLNLVASNAQEQLQRDYPWEQTCEDVVQELLSMDDLSVADEVAVFDAVKRWGIIRCKDNCWDLTPENLRRCIPDTILFTVRYLTMTPEQFDHVANHIRFTSDEAAFIVQYIENSKTKQPPPLHLAPSKMVPYVDSMAKPRTGIKMVQTKRKKKNSGRSMLTCCVSGDAEDMEGYQRVPDNAACKDKKEGKSDACAMCFFQCIASVFE